MPHFHQWGLLTQVTYRPTSYVVLRTSPATLLQPGVFRPDLVHSRKVRVGIFPGGEKILIGRFGFCCVTLQNISAGQAEARKGINRSVGAKLESARILWNSPAASAPCPAFRSARARILVACSYHYVRNWRADTLPAARRLCRSGSVRVMALPGEPARYEQIRRRGDSDDDG